MPARCFEIRISNSLYRLCEPAGSRETRPDDRLRVAIQIFSATTVWIASSLRNDVGKTCRCIPAAHIVPESCEKHVPRKSEGAGKTGCQPHPWPRVQQKARELVTTGTAEQARPSLHDGFTAYFVLSPVSQTLLSPSSARCASIVANLAPALGCQDHTTSPSVSTSHV